MYSKYFYKNETMRQVFYTLIPIIIYGIYVFGWRVLFLLIFNLIIAILLKLVIAKYNSKEMKISESIFVVSTIFTMSLPPSIPFLISLIGVVFVIVFEELIIKVFKENFLNKLMIGRLFIYILFPKFLTRWNEASNIGNVINGLGGFSKWITPMLDTISNPTPLVDISNTGIMYNLRELIFGNHAGRIGELSIILIIGAAFYLLYRKIISYDLIISSLIGFFGSSYIFIMLGYGHKVLPPLEAIFLGGFLFSTIFIINRPTAYLRTEKEKWIYGLLFGIVTVIIRSFTPLPEGVMLSILIIEILEFIYIRKIKLKNIKIS